MKDKIIERLIDQGHIVIQCADRIINKREGYIQDIEDLHRDENISTSESIILLKESDAPNHYPLIIQPNTDWSWDPNTTGTPHWTITCSHDLDKNGEDK